MATGASVDRDDVTSTAAGVWGGVSRIGCRQRHQRGDDSVKGGSADIGGRERRGRLAFQARGHQPVARPAPCAPWMSEEWTATTGNERDPLGRDAHRA